MEELASRSRLPPWKVVWFNAVTLLSLTESELFCVGCLARQCRGNVATCAHCTLGKGLRTLPAVSCHALIDLVASPRAQYHASLAVGWIGFGQCMQRAASQTYHCVSRKFAGLLAALSYYESWPLSWYMTQSVSQSSLVERPLC